MVAERVRLPLTSFFERSLMRVHIHFDSGGPSELIVDPEGSPTDLSKLDLLFRGQEVLSIKSKENNGGSWILTIGKVDKTKEAKEERLAPYDH